MAGLRVVPAGFVGLALVPTVSYAVMALALLAGIAHAADKITFSCSGTRTSSRAPLEPQHQGPESIVIDLDRGIVMWGSDTFPIVRNAGNTIAFEAREGDTTTKGSIDLALGTLFATEEYAAIGRIQLTFELACKRPNPLF
jgi:hypothetical protein